MNFKRAIDARPGIHTISGMKVILETERLLLRELTPDDFDAMFEIFGDAETMRYYPQVYSREMLEAAMQRQFASYAENGYGLWAMILKRENQFIGDCGLLHQEVDGAQELEVGYHVNRQYWGQGFAPEAAKACFDCGFNTLGRKRMISMIRPENLPSRRVAEKNGLQIEKKVFWRDLWHYVYVLTRE
ncbi:MAG TPA: GNAT family N-acetyltransferase [Blastocatellia bacterium]|nr:GNAT family N-acetyltransferase [Blastocatellia bacterium]